MNRTIRFAAAAAASTLIAIVVAMPAGAVGPFNGTYRGTVKLVRNVPLRPAAGPSCPGSGAGVPGTRTVVNSKIKMEWAGSDVELTVGPDGTASGSENVRRLQFSASGKITGNTMVLEYGGQFCGYRFEGQKGGAPPAGR